MVQARTEELAASNESLQRLSEQLLHAQDEERRRIARELHDSTGQVLAALSLTISAMQRDSQGGDFHKFAECKAMIAMATEEIRNLSYLLHPPLIDEVGLGSAVVEYAKGFEKRSGLKIQVEIAEDVGRLAENREIVLYRIIQEGLGNIHRHSGSATASVRIFCVGNDVVLEIADHGRGMPAGSNGTLDFGVGIRSMKERLRPFGGRLRIESNGFGVKLKAEMPRGVELEMAAAQSA